MLNELQMELVEHLYDSMKNLLFEKGKIGQSYVISQGGEAIVLPLSPEMQLGTGLSMEFAEELSQMGGVELVIFISETWYVKRGPEGLDKKEITEENWQDLASKNLCDGKTPSQLPDKAESLMMMVLEVKTKKLHMKMGDIKRDSEGGAYIEEAEWQPEADLNVVKTTAFPSKLLS